jgi:hypothetical protein
MFDHVLDRILKERAIDNRRGQLQINVEIDLRFEAQVVDSFLRSAVTTGRIANTLRNQLVMFFAGVPAIRQKSKYVFDAEAIIRTIRDLEHKGALSSKGPQQIKKGALAGLWKAHFFQSSFIPQNILNENANNRGMARLVKAVHQKYGSFPTEKLIDEQDIEMFARTLVGDALDQRSASGKLTGEHLFFAMHDGKRFFLHVDSHETTDEEKIQFISPAVLEFSELTTR